jgi:hypothetical protein
VPVPTSGSANSWKAALMLLKLSPFILLVIAVAAIILREVGLLGDPTASIVLAISIVSAIAIGVYRSMKSRKAKSSQ